ncbi:MAG: hypothetical protein ACLQDV_06065 [Candidatus Binataceae bacterium]
MATETLPDASRSPIEGANVPPTVRRSKRPISLRAYSRELGQAQFLELVDLMEPEVLHSLGEGPYQLLLRMNWPKTRKTKVTMDQMDREEANRTVRLAPNELPKLPGYRALRYSIDLWAMRWNLTDPWCKEWALRVLAWWRLRPSDKEKRRYFEIYRDFITDRPRDIRAPKVGVSLKIDLSFGKHTETVVQYKRRTDREFRSQVDSARASFIEERKKYLRNLAKSPDWSEPRQLRTGRKQFIWLAGFQVKDWSYYQIAKASGDTDSRATISKQIKGSKQTTGLAEFIGLTLRTPQTASGEDASTISKQVTSLVAIFR